MGVVGAVDVAWRERWPCSHAEVHLAVFWPSVPLPHPPLLRHLEALQVGILFVALRLVETAASANARLPEFFILHLVCIDDVFFVLVLVLEHPVFVLEIQNLLSELSNDSLLLFAGEVAPLDLLNGLVDLLLMQRLLFGNHHPELLSLLLILSQSFLEELVEIPHFVKLELQFVDKLLFDFVIAALLVGALPPVLLLLESLLPFSVRLE